MYQILIKKRAKKFIDKLPARDKRRVVEAIRPRRSVGSMGFQGVE